MKGLPVLPAHQLRETEPDERWLIEELWGHEAVGIIGGEPKCSKSFLALAMGIAVASGKKCLGRFAVPKPGRVLLFAAEDALHTVHERLVGICAQAGIDLATLDLWVITAPSVRLDRDCDCIALAATVEQLRPALLILDPFVRMHRIDENVSVAVAPLLETLRQLQRSYHCAVALVHHARKDAGRTRAGQALRGSSEFHAWGDAILYLRRRGKTLRLSAEHRAHKSPDDCSLELQEDPLALIYIDKPDVEDSSAPPQQDPQQRVINALRTLGRRARARELRQLCHMRSETLTGILNELVEALSVDRSDDGWLLIEPSRTPSQAGFLFPTLSAP